MGISDRMAKIFVARVRENSSAQAAVLGCVICCFYCERATRLSRSQLTSVHQ